MTFEELIKIDDMSISEIAKRTGKSRMAIYKNMRSKVSLGNAIDILNAMGYELLVRKPGEKARKLEK